MPCSAKGVRYGGRLKVAARTWKHQSNGAYNGVTLHRFEFRSFASNSVAAHHSYVRILGFLEAIRKASLT